MSARFHYDPSTGQCVNGSGQQGLNELSWRDIVRTSRAECVDFAGRNLSKESMRGLWKDTSGRSFSFDDVDFRGANLRDVVFPPYNSPGRQARLQGADARGAHDAYGRGFSGIIDRFTQLDARCQPETPSTDVERAVTCPAAGS